MDLKKLHQIILENNRLRRSLTELYPDTYKRYEKRAIEDKRIADAMVDISRDNLGQVISNSVNAYTQGTGLQRDQPFDYEKFMGTWAKMRVLKKLASEGENRSKKRGRGINLARAAIVDPPGALKAAKAAKLRQQELPASFPQITGG